MEHQINQPPSITMDSVESSQIAAIGHDAASNTLAIQFAGKAGPGSLYHYQNVDAATFAAFKGAESVGSHFYKHIKPFADKFPYVKVETQISPVPATTSALTKEALAALLTGREYLSEITKEEEQHAKMAGLVVIFGASDDLMELRGAINDEFNCYAGGTALIDAKGLLPERDDIEDDGVLKDYFTRMPTAKAIDALWGTEGYGWTYHTVVPHATFDIVEDDEKYCRGIVINIADLAG